MQRRAIILVLDSFGIGAAADAAQFGDAGADTLGHIAASLRRRPCRQDRRAVGPAACAQPGALGPRPRGGDFDRRRSARAGNGSHRRRLWLRRRGEQGQGHAERPLGDGRLSGPVRLGLFPARAPVLPAGADRSSWWPSSSCPASSATATPRAPRSSRNSARSISGPASRSATPRPTACSRSPRTSSISDWSGSIASASAPRSCWSRSTSAA